LLLELNSNRVTEHSPAYLYGFGLGKKAELRGYYDIMGPIKQFTLQAVNKLVIRATTVDGINIVI
jgi:hypothetical protein